MLITKPTAWSSIVKKFITGLTGLGLALFVFVHLLGNLLLLVGPEEYNAYAYLLEHKLLHGWFIYIAEAGLIFFFALHMISAVSVRLRGIKTRGTPYYRQTSAGGVSRQNFASRTMVLTGVLLVLFIVVHLKMFKFGEAGMVEVVSGLEMRDVYTMVVETFKVPWIALAYAFVMLSIGLHLRHGIWSGLHSLGLSNERYLPVIYAGGFALALLLTLGYVLLPLIVLLFFADPSAAGGA